jgi:5'-nucleotidase/UDP-sugar diphosphatase
MIRYRHLINAFVVAFLTSHSIACAQPTTITILHTNDMHASFVPHEAFWISTDPKPMVGGFKELWWTLDSIRRANPNTLLLDAGDVMTGNPISDVEYRGAMGGALFEMMNRLGYDAWTIGNHDLDISQANLKKLIGILNAPVTSANVVDTAGHFPFSNKEYVILEKAGVKIGVIGVMTTELFRVTNTNNLGGLKVLPPIETTQRLVDQLASEVDLIIALTHQGAEEDSVLAANVHGLHAIVGGHSHTRLRTPKLVNGVTIVQAGANCENLGVLELTVDKKSITQPNGKLLQLWVRHEVPPTALSTLVDSMEAVIDKDFAYQIGTLTTDWKRGRSESNIGNFVADALQQGGKADIAVTNSSGIRKDLRAGPITKRDLFEIMPFRNTLCTFHLSGKEVREFVERHVRAINEGGSSLQIAGIQCTWKRVDGQPSIESVTIGGVPLDEGRIYTCATSDFVVDQADKYLGIKPEGVTFTDKTVFQVLVEKVTREKTLSSQIENRFREIH